MVPTDFFVNPEAKLCSWKVTARRDIYIHTRKISVGPWCLWRLCLVSLLQCVAQGGWALIPPWWRDTSWRWRAAWATSWCWGGSWYGNRVQCNVAWASLACTVKSMMNNIKKKNELLIQTTKFSKSQVWCLFSSSQNNLEVQALIFLCFFQNWWFFLWRKTSNYINIDQMIKLVKLNPLKRNLYNFKDEGTVATIIGI